MFEFNEHDVCVNPNIPVQWDGKYTSVTIRTSQNKDGLWSFGESWQSSKNGYCGCGCPCVSTNAEYHSEKDAIIACIDKLKDRLKFDKEAVSKLDEIKGGFIFVQQSLF